MTWRSKLEKLAMDIAKAHKKRKAAEAEYKAHEWDWHIDPKIGETLTSAKEREEKLLNRLERMLI